MDFAGVQVWGDSIFKGVVYDSERGRYSILKQNAVNLVSEKMNIGVINKSRMGRTAPQALEALAADESDMSGAAVVIELGGNDCDYNWEEIANAPESEHICKTPAQEFILSLKRIAELVRERMGVPVICTLPPLNANKYFNWITRNGLSKDNILKYIGQTERIYRWQEYYSNMALRVAGKLGCECLPIREGILERLRGEDIWCDDGIHLNALGHLMMADAVCSSVHI